MERNAIWWKKFCKVHFYFVWVTSDTGYDVQRGISQHASLNVCTISLPHRIWKRETCRRLVVTLNLCLVHHKVFFIAAVLKLFALTTMDARLLVLRLVEGEERGRVAAVTSISRQDGQGFFLEQIPGVTTRSRAQITPPQKKWRRRLTLSVHMSTHLSTDMFWMTALKGRARVTLSGLRKQPFKMALPSERRRQTRLARRRDLHTLQLSFHDEDADPGRPEQVLTLTWHLSENNCPFLRRWKIKISHQSTLHGHLF